MAEDFYMIVGRVIYGGMDAEGDIHIVLKNNSPVWAESAARFLKFVEGRIVKLKVSVWRSSKPGKGHPAVRAETTL
ncbi:MAG: hypothetical protein FGF50_09230 [Candidatus Brockarchaeota archaeon]|nr:hypothetical protein [Candidatus Brockarchaeota archaeon]